MFEIVILLLTIAISSVIVSTCTIILFKKMWGDYFILNRKYNVAKKKEV